MSDASELAVGDLEYPLGPGKAVLLDRRLVRTQKRYAAMQVGIPALATGYALVLAVHEGVSSLNVTLFLVFYFVTLIGIGVGFHRLFSHRAFTAERWTKIALAVCGTWAAQGPVLHWVSIHRRHHMSTDRDGDPHSPQLSGAGAWDRLKGLVHAHVGAMFAAEVTNYARFAPDLLRDPDLVRINRSHLLIILAGLALPAAIGWLATQGLEGAWTALLWGGFVRMFAVHHAIWSVNSIGHMFGAKTFRSGDESRNSYLLALLTAGEGWHNTHHAFPKAAIVAASSRHIDICGMVVGGLEKIGLAKGVHRIPPESKKAKSLI
jgi:stearoyl-CoA desaturase (delta-9 desaturase)